MCYFHVQAKEIADLQEDIVALEEELEAANVLCEVKEEQKAVSNITSMKLSVCTSSDLFNAKRSTHDCKSLQKVYMYVVCCRSSRSKREIFAAL